MIGNRIKQRREELGLTQEELGKALQLNKSTIQRYESGKVDRIKLPILLSIAKQLNVSTDYLLGHTDDPAQIANGDPAKRVKIAARKTSPPKPRPKEKKQAPARRSRKVMLDRLKAFSSPKPEVRKEEETAMKEDMSSYVRELGRSLMSYSRNNVYRIIYISNDKGEFAEISFTDGSKKLVNITGDSCLAATLDITKALI